MFDMDAMRDEILEKEKQTEKTTSESVVHRSDNIIAKKRRELNDIPVVSAASLLSPDEARKLKSFSNKTKHENKAKSKIQNNNNNNSENCKKNNNNNNNNVDNIEIDIDSDASDDEIAYMKKKKKMEAEQMYEPGRTSGRYEGSGSLFSRDADDNMVGDDDGIDNDNNNATSIGFKSIKTFVQKHVNFQMIYFSLLALSRQIKKFLEEYKIVIWLLLSFLLIYKFLF